jgi:hypothetical protein
MLDNQENKLPDATENQASEANENPNAEVENTEVENTEVENTEVENTEVENTDSEVIKEPDVVKDETSHAVKDIENHIAKKSESDDEDHELAEIVIDEAIEIEEVVALLQKIIKEYPIQKIGQKVDELKKVFNVKFGTLLKEARQKHNSEGGEPSDFHYENPIQKEYNDVLFEYKSKRQEYQKKITKEREDNYKAKLEVIEEIKDLIENGNPDNIFHNFKELQNKWKEIGAVPREHYGNLWRTYQFHIERFYDLLHLSNELRDMDFEHNLQEKMKLVLRVESLVESDDIKTAFDELQIIHKMWKEDIGPVSREYREEVWNRFSAATKKIHDKRHDFFDSLKEQYEQNLLKKEALLEELEQYNDNEYTSHAEWQKGIKEVEELRKRFIKTGRVPRAKDKEIWEKFRSVNKVFNHAKNQYYKGIKKDQQENLNKKMKLIEIAESYRESEDWDHAVDVMKKIQNDWRNIGHVPRRVSDKIWNRFKEACNNFFDRYRQAQDAMEESQMSVYIQKKKYLEELKSQATSEDFEPSLDQLMGYVKEWRAFGVVPVKQRYIDVKFNKFLDPYFEKVSDDKTQAIMMRYKAMIDTYMEQNDTYKLNDELQFVRKKIDQITREKQQIETNRQFFNTDESNPMMRNIDKEIDKLSFELEIWESKLQYLRTLEF